MKAFLYALLLLSTIICAEKVTVKIKTPEDLVKLSIKVNGGSEDAFHGTAILENDLDMNEASSSFKPVGTFDYSFIGTFDGQGHVISNLNITSKGTRYVGLFGASIGMALQNMILDSSCSISTTDKGTNDNGFSFVLGGFVGACYTNLESCTLKNLINMASLTSYNFEFVGGIAGHIISTNFPSLVTNCLNFGSVSSFKTISYNFFKAAIPCSVGGIVGKIASNKNEMQSRIINCANYAPTAISLLDLISSAGGIVGTLGYGSSIQNCLNVGDSVNSIPPGGNLAGGIESTEKTDVNIENCYWFANAHNGICVVSNIENATVKDVAAFSRGLTLSKPVVVSGEAKTNVIDALNSMKNYEFEKWMVLDLNGGEMWNEGTSFYKIPVFRNKAIFVEPKKNNSIFDGWYKDNEFKTKVNPATDDIAFVDVLYAKWVFFVNVTLTYEAKKVVMIIRNDVEINYPNVDSRGFKVEWCTLDRVVCNPKTADESIELYLVQTLESFTLSFNTTIGNINIEPKMITFGEDIGELPVPEKDGLMFLGWYTDLELKQPFYEKKMPWYNLTLYAKWRDTASEEKVFSWLVTLACIAVSVGASVVVFTKREIIGINI